MIKDESFMDVYGMPHSRKYAFFMVMHLLWKKAYNMNLLWMCLPAAKPCRSISGAIHIINHQDSYKEEEKKDQNTLQHIKLRE